jgi:NADH-quinone oxidoreductase subunit N
VVILAATALGLLVAQGYLRREEVEGPEYHALLLLSASGMLLMTSANDLIVVFLALEILSIALYVLAAFDRSRLESGEAGLKYFVLGAFSSAVLLYGVAMVYGATGTTSLSGIAAFLAANTLFSSGLLLAGFALILVGLGFKVAAVPFHMWTPDVYQGAPAPIAAFVATASKGAVFAVLLRFFVQVHVEVIPSLALAIGLIAALSMFVGNLLALTQKNVKRILAYSSIAHLGYLLIALRARGPLAVEAAGYYLAAYVLTMLTAFGVVTVLSSREREAEDLDDYRGLFWRRPWLAATLSTALLSLAAIPLTGGFVGKFYLIAAGASSSLWPLLVVLAVNSGIGLFYYLRILVAMYSMSEGVTLFGEPKVPVAAGVALVGLVAGVLWLGLYPAPIVRLLRAASPAVIASAR